MNRMLPFSQTTNQLSMLPEVCKPGTPSPAIPSSSPAPPPLPPPEPTLTCTSAKYGDQAMACPSNECDPKCKVGQLFDAAV